MNISLVLVPADSFFGMNRQLVSLQIRIRLLLNKNIIISHNQTLHLYRVSYSSTTGSSCILFNTIRAKIGLNREYFSAFTKAYYRKVYYLNTLVIRFMSTTVDMLFFYNQFGKIIHFPIIYTFRPVLAINRPNFGQFLVKDKVPPLLSPTQKEPSPLFGSNCCAMF